MRQGFSIYAFFAFRYSSWKKIDLICFTYTSFYKVPGDPHEVHLACHSDTDPRDSTFSHTQLKPNCVIWYEMLHPHGNRLPPLLSVNLSHALPCSPVCFLHTASLHLPLHDLRRYLLVISRQITNTTAPEKFPASLHKSNTTLSSSTY